MYHFSTETAIKLVSMFPHAIQFFNQTQELELAAITHNFTKIINFDASIYKLNRNMVEPIDFQPTFTPDYTLTEDTVIHLVTQIPDAIFFIPDPSDKVKRLASASKINFVRTQVDNIIQHRPKVPYRFHHVYQLLQDPTEETTNQLITLDGTNIRYVEEQTEELQLLAVQANTAALKFIDEPTYDVQKLAVSITPDSIADIDNQTPELQMMVVSKMPNLIILIDNPTDQVRDFVLQKNPRLKSYIKNPVVSLQQS